MKLSLLYLAIQSIYNNLATLLIFNTIFLEIILFIKNEINEINMYINPYSNFNLIYNL